MEELGMNGAGIGYWIAMFLLGGTNLWSIVMYVLERRKRNVEIDGSKADVSQKEFDTVKDQFEVFDKRLESYSSSLMAAEATITDLRNKNDELQRDRLEMRLAIFKLQQELEIDKETIRQKDLQIENLKALACTEKNCPNRNINL